jgi:hypothetical protein
MRKAFRIVGTVLSIGAITLFLDAIVTATILPGVINTDRDAAEAGNRRAYVHADYHHDIFPGHDMTRVWGRIIYPWKSDGYGFRTGTCGPGEAEKAWPAIFVIGDSFVEAIGSSYEQSFAGLMACDAAKQKKAVWNLGVSSYSPIIYWRKVQAAADKLGRKPSEVYVFLDLSDIEDEANIYREGPDGTVLVKSKPEPSRENWDSDPKQWLVRHFTTARLIYDTYVSASFTWDRSVGHDRGRWPFDQKLLESWGWRGLELAGANLDKLVGLCRDWQCRVTLVVYPWPDNVVAKDRDSLQVRHWRDWSAARGVRFVDGFAPFFKEPADATLRRYYIKGDVHFTSAGNQLIYEMVRQAVDGNW